MTHNPPPHLTVIVVSYNTIDLTLECLRSLQANTTTPHRVVVFDNNSHDGSADAVAKQFPEVHLIRSPENIGFARANNAVAREVDTQWLLLLNPDTEVFPDAVDALVRFGESRPGGGIYGGRTVFPDGSLNIASCWNAITPWSAFCMAVGLTAIFPRTKMFDTEAIGPWQRDSIMEVDIVVGCFLLIRTELWRRLGGFDAKYVMYGEEADLCLRAEALGYRPVITPDATIMHIVGASSQTTANKLIMVAKARTTLIRSHWPASKRWWGTAMMLTWGAVRVAATAPLRWSRPETAEKWRKVWRARQDWLEGYR